MQAVDKDPLDATLFANMSLCWLRMREGERALEDARKCKMMRPGWSKAWYREGAALSFLKVHASNPVLRLDLIPLYLTPVVFLYAHRSTTKQSLRSCKHRNLTLRAMKSRKR
jgi:hypothetical protein